jgi:hypothetical protein
VTGGVARQPIFKSIKRFDDDGAFLDLLRVSGSARPRRVRRGAQRQLLLVLDL